MLIRAITPRRAGAPAGTKRRVLLCLTIIRLPKICCVNAYFLFRGDCSKSLSAPFDTCAVSVLHCGKPIDAPRGGQGRCKPDRRRCPPVVFGKDAPENILYQVEGERRRRAVAGEGMMGHWHAFFWSMSSRKQRDQTAMSRNCAPVSGKRASIWSSKQWMRGAVSE